MEQQTISASYSVAFGCDPEFFFKTGGKVVVSEKCLPEAGLVFKSKPGQYPLVESHCGENKIVVDGVQAELNPRPSTCRANLINELSYCFQNLRTSLAGKDIADVDFSAVVKLSQQELDELSEKSKALGCKPSLDIEGHETKVTINPATHQFRSAGGHIHLGMTLGKGRLLPKNIVRMHDYIVGNTCVLLDRDPLAAERRKVYGKASEHRLPKWGLEYRTLSNFWLRSEKVTSLVLGLSRLAVAILESSGRKVYKWNSVTHQNDYVDIVDFEQMILDTVPFDDIIRAINTNDFDLAYANYRKIEVVLAQILPEYAGADLPFTQATLPLFHHFVFRGLDYWFKETNPFEHWCNIPEGHGNGWESFLNSTVNGDYVEYIKPVTEKCADALIAYNPKWPYGCRAERFNHMRTKKTYYDKDYIDYRQVEIGLIEWKQKTKPILTREEIKKLTNVKADMLRVQAKA